MHSKEQKIRAFGQLLDVMDELRERCPWDREQTNESLRANTIEEVYELSEAILKNKDDELKRELGDVLLHIVFYAKIGEEQRKFDVKDVCDALCEKLIFRHPHVFGETSVTGSEQVEQNWEQIKLKEKNGNQSVLAGIPPSLPSLIKAYRMQDKARNVGFDWTERGQVWEKVREEFSELQQEIDRLDAGEMENEFGDLFFSLINAARLYGINPENALERTNQKFIRRFNYLEENTLKKGRSLKNMTLEEMDEIWDEAKAKGL
jgi:XTP/dITP diphosphohydrolase